MAENQVSCLLAEEHPADAATGRRVGPSRERAVRQVHDVLRASIRRGLLRPAQPLVEFQLVRSLGVARNTLREALQTLAEEGLVTRRPGVGTLVTRPMMRVGMDDILTFDAEGQLGSQVPAARVSVTLLADEPVEFADLAQVMGFPSGRLRLIETLVSVDDEPACVLATYMPPGAENSHLAVTGLSMPVSFEQFIGAPLGSTATTLEAITADTWTADALGIPVGAPLILREQILTSSDGAARIVTFTRYRADRVMFDAQAAVLR